MFTTNDWIVLITILAYMAIMIAIGFAVSKKNKTSSDFFLGGIASKCPEAVAAVISSAGYVAVCWLFLYFLYRKNVFLKV